MDGNTSNAIPSGVEQIAAIRGCVWSHCQSIRSLTLSKSWLGSENPHLTRELLNELSGILKWSLDGLEPIQKSECFTEPDTSRDAAISLQDLVSPVGAFVRESCELGPYDVAVDELYDAWRLWALDNGQRVISAQTLGQSLRAVIPGLKVVRPREAEGKRRRRYSGLKVADRVPIR